MTAPHYGRREPGALTAASPGDTLYFNFGSYNDSGDSEVLTGLAVTDIEVIKNGSATVRATDSGYSLISDTGMVGDRGGLYRFSVQLFNTADDATFYASGAWYQVFVDSVTIDGKTVRFWCGSFEIGRQRVNAYELFSDTGAANQIKNAFANGFHDTGLNDHLGRIRSDVDTGLRNTMADYDTGLRDFLNDMDTGLEAHITLRVNELDTGVKNRFDKLAEDTGGVNINSIQGDTGAAGWLKAAFTTGFTDTGLNARLAAIQTKTDSLTFTVAGQVDANIQYVNDVAITGIGDSGTANTWRPA